MRLNRLASHVLAAACTAVAWPAAAQQFTTAAEVRPMLDITRDSWVSLREWNGEDQLLFTQIVAWRCGLDRIRYAVNGGGKKKLPLEPCYEGEIRPNAVKARDVLPYVTLPGGSVETVAVWLDYDDGSSDRESYARAAILSR